MRLSLDTNGRLDQTIGRLAEPITRIVHFKAPVAGWRLHEQIGTADSIAFVIGDLVADLVDRYRARELGGWALDSILQRVDGTEQTIVFGTVHLNTQRCGWIVEAKRLAAMKSGHPELLIVAQRSELGVHPITFRARIPLV